MKTLAIVFISIFIFVSCTKKEDPAPTPNNPTTGTGTIDVSNATLISKGTFSSLNNYSVKGNVSLYETANERVLVFENFVSPSGPDLRIYLSNDNNATSFYEVGRLSGNNGNYQYAFPKSISIANFSRTLIWCKQFSVGFGTATLSK